MDIVRLDHVRYGNRAVERMDGIDVESAESDIGCGRARIKMDVAR